MRRFLFCVLLSAGVAQAEEQTAACKAASAKVDYGNFLVIPDDTKELIESYRSDWRAFCSGTKSRPTLADLYASAKQVEKQAEMILNELSDEVNEGGEDDWNKIKINIQNQENVARNALIKEYPQFVPAFQGGLSEILYFSPLRDEFMNNARRGTEEDRLFFSSEFHSDVIYPWVHGEFGDEGCVRHGEFDWLGQLKLIANLKKRMNNEIYKREIDDYGERFLGLLTPMEIYTCSDEAAVLTDLEMIRGYLEKEPMLASHVEEIQKAIMLIESGQTKIESRPQ